MNRLLSVQRVAVAVLPMDQFTGGSAIPGGVRVYMKDIAASVQKKNGYVVFWDNGSTERTVILESPFYEREEIWLDMKIFQKKRMPALHVWLRPGHGYPYPSGIRLLKQETEPDTVVTVPLEESAGVIQLLGAYPADRICPRQIQLRVPEGVEIEGRTLLIRRLSDGKQEELLIWEENNRSMGLYEMAMPLKEVYSVYDTEILMVIQMRADREGRYTLPVLNK